MNKKFLIVFGIIFLIWAIVCTSGAGLFKKSINNNISSSSLKKGLVGYWPLDGENYNFANGRITDKSAYSNYCTNSGAVLAIDRMGKINGSMDFDSSDYLNCGNNASLKITKDQTYSFWIYPHSFSVRRNPINKAYGGEGTITLETSGGLSYYWGTSGGDATPYQSQSSTRNLILNQWNHVVHVRDISNNQMVWYINGVPSGTAAPSYASAAVSSKDFLIGNGYCSSIDGAMQDVRVYNRALSADEVITLYDSYKPKVISGSLQKGLIIDMPFDLNNYNSATGRVTDKTPYVNHGTNNGATFGANEVNFVTNDWIDLPYGAGINPSTSPQTFSMWVKSNNPASSTIFFSASQVPTSSSRMYLGTYGGDWEMGIQNGAWGDGTTDVSSYWTHLVLVMNGSNANLYINGDFDHQKAYSSYTFNQNIDVGRHDASYYWNGNISDLKIYNRALSADEVKSLYDRGR